MANSFYKNKMNIRGGGIVKLLIVAILLFTTSCNNLIQVQDKHGSLSIAVPGGRATADNLSYTVSITDLAGNSQTKTVSSGQTVTFEELTPGTYTIAVEGKEVVQDTTAATTTEKVVYYGSTTASVTAGASTSATVNLGPVASNFDDLKTEVAAGGTVALYGEIKVTEGLAVTNEVTLVAANDGAKLTNASDAPLFTVPSGGSLTLGDGTSSLTVDGNGKPAYGVLVESGELVMKDNVTITNAGNSGVNISFGTFTMEGGTISNNTATSYAGGVHIGEGATFDMKGGIITGNTGGDGNGVFVAGKSTFSMSGDAIVKNNDVKLNGDAVITVSGALTGTTTPVATITPSDYTSTAPVLGVLEGSGVTLANVVSKFAITPQKLDISTINYAVDGDGKFFIPVTDEGSLRTALSVGGTVSVSGDISVKEGLTINKNVTLVASSGTVTLTNNNITTAAPLFTVSTGGNLTLGGGSGTLILDGNSKATNGILVNGGTCTLGENATVQKAGDSGIKVTSGTFNLDGGTISQNTANTGGGIYIDSSIVTMNKGIISNNTGYMGAGGVYVSAESTFTMENGEITGNTAGGAYYNAFGGGVYVAKPSDDGSISGGRFTLKAGTISNNEADIGAGVYVDGTDIENRFSMSGGTITNNINTIPGLGRPASAGSGVYANMFSMSGSAIITGNDVVCSRITLLGALSNSATVATITPQNYNIDTQILIGSSLATDYSKFTVTPSSDGTEYTIDSSGYLRVKSD